MAEVKDKILKALGYLDLEQDLRKWLPGPSNDELKDSRLDSLITGNARPIEHLDKEAKAWVYPNVTLPVVLAAVKGAAKGGRIARAIGAVNDTKPKNITTTAVDKATGMLQKAEGPKYVPDDFYQKLSDLEKGTASAVEETGKSLKKITKEAAKEAKENKPKTIFGKFLKLTDMALNPKNGPLSEANLEHAAAKKAQKDIKTAAKAFYETSTKAPGDVLDESMARAAGKTGSGAIIAEKAGKAISDNANKKRYDGKLELSMPEKVLNELNGLVGKAIWDPNDWPMEKISQLLSMTNMEADLWDEDELENLSDEAKIKLVSNIMKGKYDDYGKVSDLMRQNYLTMTNKGEVRE